MINRSSTHDKSGFARSNKDFHRTESIDEDIDELDNDVDGEMNEANELDN